MAVKNYKGNMDSIHSIHNIKIHNKQYDKTRKHKLFGRETICGLSYVPRTIIAAKMYKGRIYL